MVSCDDSWSDISAVKYFSQFHPNKLRRHTVSFDNLDDVENMSSSDGDDDDDDGYVTRRDEVIDTDADTNPLVHGKWRWLTTLPEWADGQLA